MLNQEFMNTLSPVELQFFQSYAYKLVKEKVTEQTENYENLSLNVCECPTCHFKTIRRNRKKNGRQRFECMNQREDPMPISLYEAYGSYHYGIFADLNKDQHLS